MFTEWPIKQSSLFPFTGTLADCSPSSIILQTWIDILDHGNTYAPVFHLKAGLSPTGDLPKYAMCVFVCLPLTVGLNQEPLQIEKHISSQWGK